MNKQKSHQSRVHKPKYEKQFHITAANKARRAKQRVKKAAKRLAKKSA